MSQSNFGLTQEVVSVWFCAETSAGRELQTESLVFREISQHQRRQSAVFSHLRTPDYK